jgi:hypothetical protein
VKLPPAEKVERVADKVMDPAGVLAVFGYMMLRRFTGFELSQEELLYAAMSAGVLRAWWEQRKRARTATPTSTEVQPT